MIFEGIGVESKNSRLYFRLIVIWIQKVRLHDLFRPLSKFEVDKPIKTFQV